MGKTQEKPRELKSGDASPRKNWVNARRRPKELKIKTDKSEANAKRVSLKYDYAISEDETASPQNIIKKSRGKM